MDVRVELSGVGRQRDRLPLQLQRGGRRVIDDEELPDPSEGEVLHHLGRQRSGAVRAETDKQSAHPFPSTSTAALASRSCAEAP